MSGWVAIDIGCLECSEASNLLGVYTTAEAALAAHPRAHLRSDMTDGWPGPGKVWGGQGMTVVFELPEVQR